MNMNQNDYSFSKPKTENKMSILKIKDDSLNKIAIWIIDCKFRYLNYKFKVLKYCEGVTPIAFLKCRLK